MFGPRRMRGSETRPLRITTPRRSRAQEARAHSGVEIVMAFASHGNEMDYRKRHTGPVTKGRQACRSVGYQGIRTRDGCRIQWSNR